ncbi:hypothetical protein [Cohnella sp. AR92]|uniref:hypothetical protein n=1 Tax=Cohnella sp. AR92 TaxID=648716 RepID=UPI000F8E2535|nr:hypothetical protein [Cohnella sp. AR92]RUS45829.1 hypothetical protein ELR57_18430 [Cohnella sp. AR92]
MEIEKRIRDQIIIEELNKASIEQSGLGGVGASLVSGLLKTVNYKQTLIYPHNQETTKEHLREIFNRFGRLINISKHLDTPHLSAIIPSGFLNMTPALVIAEFEPNDARSTKINFFGTAKEGLINSKAGKKAVLRAIEALKQ